jgi:hypothetical protein
MVKLPNEHPRLCGDGPRRRRRSYLDMAVTQVASNALSVSAEQKNILFYGKCTSVVHDYKRGYRSSDGSRTAF